MWGYRPRYWRRWHRVYPPPWFPYEDIPPNPDWRLMSKEDELKMLEEEEAMLEDTLEELRKRKKEIQKEVE